MANKIDKEVSRLQSGFRPGTRTREGISNLRIICERATDVQKDVYICFIDYTKTFDRVKHFKMIECLSEIGIDNKDLQIITKLYWEQSACVRTESGMTSEFKITKGVRQGCVLSPNLFNLFTRKIQTEEMKRFRRLLGISYKDHITNEEVRSSIRKAIGSYEELLSTAKRRKMKWYGACHKRFGTCQDSAPGHFTRRGKERQTEKTMGR